MRRRRVFGMLLFSISLLLNACPIIPPYDGERGTYFAKKTYTPEPIPTYEEAVRRLPNPFLEDNPEWVELYWKCWEILYNGHIKKPIEGSPFVSNYLDESFDENIFQWDTIFMVMFARYGHAVFPAVQSFDNFYCRQRDDGLIWRVFLEATGEEHWWGNFPNSVNPPLFAWGEAESYRLSGDRDRLELVLPVVEKYAEWLEVGRKKEGTVHGLYWNSPEGSGMDNTPRRGSGWVDMSAQMVLQYESLAYICDQLDLRDQADFYKGRAEDISVRVNRWMWAEEDGFYYDVENNGEKVRSKTIASFWPLLAGIADEHQAQRLVDHLHDPHLFWRKTVFPSLAADQPRYNPSGQYWLGGVWAPTNYAVIKGLERYGYEDFAIEATARYLDALYAVFVETGTVWEAYAPDQDSPATQKCGIALCRPEFVGWTGLGPIGLLIENILGFRIDGTDNHLTWHLNRTDRHGIERLQVGTASTSLAYEPGASTNKAGTITVTTDQAMILTVIKGANKMTFDLGSGRTTITLEEEAGRDSGSPVSGCSCHTGYTTAEVNAPFTLHGLVNGMLYLVPFVYTLFLRKRLTCS